MTRDELAAVRARAEATTIGRWSSGMSATTHHDDCLGGTRCYGIVSLGPGEAGVPVTNQCAGMSEKDARFTSHAKQDVPRLLDHIDALEGLLADAALDGLAGGLALRYRRALEAIVVAIRQGRSWKWDSEEMQDIARKALEDTPCP